jgi:hypothetical protein
MPLSIFRNDLLRDSGLECQADSKVFWEWLSGIFSETGKSKKHPWRPEEDRHG